MSEELARIEILRVGLSLPCTVPVLPGTPTVNDPLGQTIPLEHRTEFCAVDAWWLLHGIQPICDIHMRVACETLEIDFDELVEEAGGLNATEQLPWDERHRYEQESVPRPPEKP